MSMCCDNKMCDNHTLNKVWYDINIPYFDLSRGQKQNETFPRGKLTVLFLWTCRVNYT